MKALIGSRHEFMIGRIEVGKFRVAWKLVKTVVSIRRQSDQLTMHWICPVFEQPEQKSISDTWLPGRVNFILILIENQEGII